MDIDYTKMLEESLASINKRQDKAEQEGDDNPRRNYLTRGSKGRAVKKLIMNCQRLWKDQFPLFGALPILLIRELNRSHGQIQYVKEIQPFYAYGPSLEEVEKFLHQNQNPSVKFYLTVALNDYYHIAYEGSDDYLTCTNKEVVKELKDCLKAMQYHFEFLNASISRISEKLSDLERIKR